MEVFSWLNGLNFLSMKWKWSMLIVSRIVLSTSKKHSEFKLVWVAMMTSYAEMTKILLKLWRWVWLLQQDGGVVLTACACYLQVLKL